MREWGGAGEGGGLQISASSERARSRRPGTCGRRIAVSQPTAAIRRAAQEAGGGDLGGGGGRPAHEPTPARCAMAGLGGGGMVVAVAAAVIAAEEGDKIGDRRAGARAESRRSGCATPPRAAASPRLTSEYGAM